MITVALSQLLTRRVHLTPAEVVAIAQALAAGPGVPVADNVELSSDGSVRCMDRTGAPTVLALAALVDLLLPPRGVPAPLRYTVARAMGAVTAPEFPSVAAFSQALGRFESGDRREIIRHLLDRARPAPVMTAETALLDLPLSVSAPLAVPPPIAAPARHWGARALAVVVALLLSGAAGFYGAERWLPVADAPGPPPPPQVPAGRTATAAPAAPSTATPPAPVAERAHTGTSPVAVAAVHSHAFSPAFASNGTALFFQTGGARDPRSAIAVASAPSWPASDLRIMKVVDDGARNYHARPSPDGRSIAFDSDRDGERGVYVANGDGSEVRRVSGPGYAALPSWSPDGSRLAYVRAEVDAPSVWNLWIQPLRGDEPRRITSYRYGQTWTASWFPDGQRIAYSHENALLIQDLSSGAVQRYTAPVPGRLVRTPAVSPDGSQIVFQVQRSGAWMLDVRDGTMQCVLADPTAEEFAWSPDGRRFAFHSRRDGVWGVYVLSAARATS